MQFFELKFSGERKENIPGKQLIEFYDRWKKHIEQIDAMCKGTCHNNFSNLEEKCCIILNAFLQVWCLSSVKLDKNGTYQFEGVNDFSKYLIKYPISLNAKNGS